MKYKILFLQTGNEIENRMTEFLASSGFPVIRAKNLSQLHNKLSSCSFDAVLVAESQLKLYRLMPMRHLWEYRSKQTIISYAYKPGEKIKTSIYTRRNIQNPSQENPAEYINTLLQTFSPENDRFTGIRTQESHDTVLPDLNAVTEKLLLSLHGIKLHRKMRTILSVLIDANVQGIHTSMISHYVWGQESDEKKKDIQIYISKLRGLLVTVFGTEYCIQHKKGFYYFLHNTDQPGV
ncbi:hypothetical protein K7I13_02520 [Brucepastera parasyntrophica]|uniref:hypothetical protein n=1 Tax=Brucepastera parasyntrophica TaxID=2880008 RepID=UPI0021092AFD|nr:hypothetical protein [Brucepastera parasyntrophica]ULQ60210.1 hypothetical protein K7I13_02520 [Brucepastera parasyntrophica]